MKLFFKTKNIKIYQADVLCKKTFKKDSFDLTITSPPYNVGIDYQTHHDTMTYRAYLTWTRKWLENVFFWTKHTGRLCLNIPLDKNKGGIQSVGSDIIHIAKKIGWSYHTTIVWNEGNMSRRTAWGSWMSASAPYIIAPVELIVVFYKGKWKKQHKGQSDIDKKDFIAWTHGLWSFSGESKKRIGHPTPFPRELPKRCMKLFSFVGDRVFDPFLGSGTTLIEALQNHRIGIGTEIATEYCALAKKRILSCINSAKSLKNPTLNKNKNAPL